MQRIGPFRKEKGFTLVELLVSLVVGGILILCIASTFIMQKNSYENEADIRDMQMNARIAMDRAADVIRNAGLGCADSFEDGGSLQGAFRNVNQVLDAVNSNSGPDTLTVATGLQSRTHVSSVDAGSGNPVLADVKDPDNSDIFDGAYKRYLFTGPWEYNRYTEVAAIDSVSHVVTLSQSREVKANDDVFRVNVYTLTLDRNGALDIDVDGDGATDDTDGDQVPDFYIFNNTRNLRADAVATTSLERASSAKIAEGIEDIQFQYGWDADENGFIDEGEFLNADDANYDPDRVRVVRVFVLARTAKPDPDYEDTQATYTVGDHVINLDTDDNNGIDSAYDHHFYRHLLVETVMVRNLNL